MDIIETGFKTFLNLNAKSDLEDAFKIYLPGLHDVCLNGDFEETFLIKFAKIFNGIKKLSIHNWAPIKYDFLYHLLDLEELSLQTFMAPIDFKIISENLKRLEKLSIVWNETNIKNYNYLCDLSELYIDNYKGKDLTFLAGLLKLRKLRLDQPKIKNLCGIEKLQSLEIAVFGAAKSLSDVSSINPCKNLRFLEFDTCPKLRDFSPLAKLPELEVLELINCKNIESIKYINAIHSLEQLSILGTSNILDGDWEPAKSVRRAFLNKLGIVLEPKPGTRKTSFNFV